MFHPKTVYPSIYFSGAGYYLPFHFGVVKCLIDNQITFQKAFGVSAGAQAALAMSEGADLELGIRQCFDLRDETVYFTINYMFDLYGKYFEKFRGIGKRNLDELNSSLFVGVSDLRTLRKSFLSSFPSEYYLNRIISSSGNVIPFLSLLPKPNERQLLFDPLVLFPAESITLAITPLAWKMVLPKAQSRIIGSASLTSALFCTKTKMEELFVEGYEKMREKIDDPIKIVDPKLEIQKILKEKKNWKQETGFLGVKAEGFWDQSVTILNKRAFLLVCFFCTFAGYILLELAQNLNLIGDF